MIISHQKTFKLHINITAMKEILLTSIVLLTVMTVLLGLYGVAVMAQETEVVSDTNNLTETDTNNMTGEDNATEPVAGMISRKD
jgi:hypothetical protein